MYVLESISSMFRLDINIFKFMMLQKPVEILDSLFWDIERCNTLSLYKNPQAILVVISQEVDNTKDLKHKQPVYLYRTSLTRHLA